MTVAAMDARERPNPSQPRQSFRPAPEPEPMEGTITCPCVAGWEGGRVGCWLAAVRSKSARKGARKVSLAASCAELSEAAKHASPVRTMAAPPSMTAEHGQMERGRRWRSSRLCTSATPSTASNGGRGWEQHSLGRLTCHAWRLVAPSSMHWTG